MNRHASMNRIYRLVWSEAKGAYVPAAETARARFVGRSRRVMSGLAFSGAFSAAVAGASPAGGQITSGSGTITQSGGTTTIDQTSASLVVDWRSFNIAPQQIVDFVQPSSGAVAVNRITGSSGTSILGHLDANGQVYLINPNGIVFGRGAQVDVGGLVASALALAPAAPGATTQTFSGAGSAGVVNAGTITAAAGGSVALLGNRVVNTGLITAELGSVALGAGSAIALTFHDAGVVRLQIDQSVLASLAANGGVLRADGGLVLMSAGARDSLLASVVNESGIVEARSLENRAGKIVLTGGMSAGTVRVDGTLDASAPRGGNGGAIETSGAQVEVGSGARITTAAAQGLVGTWLVDPQDFTVAASGGNITGAKLGTELGATNITLMSSLGAVAGSGNVNVNDAVTWNANTTLTLTAANNVNVNAAITATGAGAGIALNPNTANGTDTASGAGAFVLGPGATINLPNVAATSTTAFVLGGTPFKVINGLGDVGSTTGTDLQGLQGALNGNFVLGSNINAAPAATWNSNAGFTPIGSNATNFTGTFDGLGHTIAGLPISAPANDDVGLFGAISGAATVRNVSLVGGSISGANYVGALVGSNGGTVSNASAVAGVVPLAVTGTTSSVGGLVGSSSGTILGSHADAAVSGPNKTGGLVGFNSGTVSGSYATGSVGAAGYSYYAGGLVGFSSGIIAASHATGSVSGGLSVGGLVGANLGSISNSYAATGAVGGTSNVGGLIGTNTNNSTVSNTYATGTVSGASDVGGLIGSNNNAGGTISNSYSAGAVTGSTNVGGLIGFSSGPVNNSFWDTTTSGQSASDGGFPMSTLNMQQQANFTSATAANGNADPGWDFAGTWVMYDGHTYPLLQTFMTPLTITANSVSKTYDGAAFTGGAGVSYSVNPDAEHLLGTLGYVGTSQGAANAGSYVITPAGLYSDQLGYILSFASGTLDIARRPVDLAGRRVYDGTTSIIAADFMLGNLVDGQTLTLSGAGTVANANVAAGTQAVTLGTLALGNGSGGGLAENYTFAGGTQTAAITPAPLSVAGSIVESKVYDGTTTALLADGTLVGLVGGGTVTLTQAGAFASKNAGTHIAVTASDTIGGASAGDYTLTEPVGLTGTITPAPLSVAGTSVASKIYDGTTTAELAGGTLEGLVVGDSVTLTQAGAFATKNAGAHIAVTAGDTIGGANAGDYTLTEPVGLTGTITPAPLSVAGTSVASKVYDGTTTAELTGGALVGLVNGDSVTLVQAGSFANAGPGADIPVTAMDSIGGASAGDYTLVEPSGLSGTITAKTAPAPTVSAADLLLAAYARAQLIESFVTPQFGVTTLFGVTPEMAPPAVPATTGAGPSLRIVDGGLRLPAGAVDGGR